MSPSNGCDLWFESSSSVQYVIDDERYWSSSMTSVVAQQAHKLSNCVSSVLSSSSSSWSMSDDSITEYSSMSARADSMSIMNVSTSSSMMMDYSKIDQAHIESIERHLRSQSESTDTKSVTPFYINLDHVTRDGLDSMMNVCDEFFANLNQASLSSDSPENSSPSPDSGCWSDSASFNNNAVRHDDGDDIEEIKNEEDYESDSLQSSCSFPSMSFSPSSSSSSEDVKYHKTAKRSIKKRVRKLRGTKNCPHIWELNRDMLKNQHKYSKLIEWVDPENLVFKILDQKGVAEEWAVRKNRDEPMKFECVGRGMRYSRNASGYFAKLTREQSKMYGKKLVFAFGSSAAKMCPWLSSIMRPDLFD